MRESATDARRAEPAPVETPVALPEDARGLAAWVADARAHSFALVEDLDGEQLLGRRLEIVNPLLWEIGHVAWFQERWVLRHALGRPPLRADADALWDSIAIPHDVRWDLPLPGRDGTFAYAREVRDRVLDVVERGDPDPQLRYFVALTVFHEDMHTEAFTYTRQTHAYPPPSFLRDPAAGPAGAGREEPAAAQGDVEVPGGPFELGARRGEPFVFDNEKWAHEVRLRPFAISRTAVTQADFRGFVEDGGYTRPELWTAEGWRWREAGRIEAPLYWRREPGGGWSRRVFDRRVPLEPELPVLHVGFHEAEAFCRWAGRRLPSEAEWEAAAAATPDERGASLAAEKRRFPWGDGPPSPERANLDWREGGAVGVHRLAAGDSAFGCRQMIGNVWEWTADAFGPFPGFTPDPYKEYSEPWFHTHRVLRGGAWTTRARLLRSTWRNFYEPHRRDVWAGFRTCAPRD